MATPSDIDVGDVVTVKMTFTRKSDGALVDPGVVTVEVRQPATTKQTFTNLTVPSIIRDSLGLYHLDYPITVPGIHRVKGIGTGQNAGVVQGSFTVRQSLT